MILLKYLFSISALLGFQDQPPTPSNKAQDLKQSADQTSYVTSIKNLCTNKGYILLLTTYGMNVGVFYAISTLLNSTITAHFDYDVSTQPT